jgi:hypothetical protein
MVWVRVLAEAVQLGWLIRVTVVGRVRRVQVTMARLEQSGSLDSVECYSRIGWLRKTGWGAELAEALVHRLFSAVVLAFLNDAPSNEAAVVEPV